MVRFDDAAAAAAGQFPICWPFVESRQSSAGRSWCRRVASTRKILECLTNDATRERGRHTHTHTQKKNVF